MLSALPHVVVELDRGLCGGLNTNLFKAWSKTWRAIASKAWRLILRGWQKGAAFFRNFGGNIVAAISHLGEEPSITI